MSSKINGCFQSSEGNKDSYRNANNNNIFPEFTTKTPYKSTMRRYIYNIMVIGAPGSGKTELVKQALSVSDYNY